MATDLQIANSALTKIGAPLITSTQWGSGTAGTTKEARLAGERLDHCRKYVLRSHPWNCAIRRAESSKIIPTGASVPDGSYPGAGDIAVTALTSFLPDNLVINFFTTAGVASGILTLDGDHAVGATSLAGSFTALVNATDTASTWNSIGVATANAAPPYDYTYSRVLPSDLLRLLEVLDADGNYRLESGNLLSQIEFPEVAYVSDLAASSFDSMLTEVLAWALAVEMAYAITQSQGVVEIVRQGAVEAVARAKTVDAQEDGRYHVEAELFDESRYGSSIFTRFRNHYRP